MRMKAEQTGATGDEGRATNTRYVKPTIRQVLDHPRYREFAQACTECGRCVVPDAHPWKFMGLSDSEFAAQDLRYEDGSLMPAAEKAAQLRVVRQMEEEVVTWWQWWLGWEYLSRGKVPADKSVPASKPAAPPGMLF